MLYSIVRESVQEVMAVKGEVRFFLREQSRCRTVVYWLFDIKPSSRHRAGGSSLDGHSDDVLLEIELVGMVVN